MSLASARECVKQTLISTAGVSKKKAIEIEKEIYNFCVRLHSQSSLNRVCGLDDCYNDQAFEILGEISSRPIDNVIADLKIDKVGWQSSLYDDCREEEEIEQQSAVEGVKVKKGEIPCKNPKCRSLETYYMTMQTRSADEPATIYLFCTKCDTKGKM